MFISFSLIEPHFEKDINCHVNIVPWKNGFFCCWWYYISWRYFNKTGGNSKKTIISFWLKYPPVQPTCYTILLRNAPHPLTSFITGDVGCIRLGLLQRILQPADLLQELRLLILHFLDFCPVLFQGRILIL